MAIDREESHRLHVDWWGKCRTCRFWTGDRESVRGVAEGTCTAKASPLHEQVTWWEGHCPKWDSFDIDVAFQILEEVEAGVL